MSDELSYTKLVAQVLSTAPTPLTLDEIWSQVGQLRPVRTKNPRATLRGAITSLPLATTLGGRPARYTWWPNHLTGSAFRQPLSALDVSSGALVLNTETWLALWPDFYVGAERSSGEVTLELADGSLLETRVEHLTPGEPVWGLPPAPALAAWYRRVGAAPGDDVIVRVLDVTARRYAASLVRQAERDQAALAARNLELADIAERLSRQGYNDMPDFYLVPRLIASAVYQHPLPPEPWEKVLRADLRFVVREGQSVVRGRTISLTGGWIIVMPVTPSRMKPITAPRCKPIPAMPTPGCIWEIAALRRAWWSRRWPTTGAGKRLPRRGRLAIRQRIEGPSGAI